MMRRVALSAKARAAGLARRFRAGVEHLADGAAFAQTAFNATEWASIEADPMLVVTDAPDGAPFPDTELALRQRMVDAITRLTPDEFLKSGAPDLGALRTALPDDARAITGKLRDTVWDEMTALADATGAQPDGGATPVPDEMAQPPGD